MRFKSPVTRSVSPGVTHRRTPAMVHSIWRLIVDFAGVHASHEDGVPSRVRRRNAADLCVKRVKLVHHFDAGCDHIRKAGWAQNFMHRFAVPRDVHREYRGAAPDDRQPVGQVFRQQHSVTVYPVSNQRADLAQVAPGAFVMFVGGEEYPAALKQVQFAQNEQRLDCRSDAALHVRRTRTEQNPVLNLG